MFHPRTSAVTPAPAVPPCLTRPFGGASSHRDAHNIPGPVTRARVIGYSAAAFHRALRGPFVRFAFLPGFQPPRLSASACSGFISPSTVLFKIPQKFTFVNQGKALRVFPWLHPCFFCIVWGWGDFCEGQGPSEPSYLACFLVRRSAATGFLKGKALFNLLIHLIFSLSLRPRRDF